MANKRSRPPGLSDGSEILTDSADPTTPVKSRSSAPRSGRKAAPSTPSRKTAQTTPKSKPQAKVIQNRIKVGVDFGTTNSGVAHVMSLGDAQDVEVIKNWPGGVRNNEQLEKVPSRIAFAAENPNMEEDKWGYEVPPGAQSYTWFKLRLDADADITAYDSERLTGNLQDGLLQLPDDMTAEEVTAAYLTQLYDHTMDVLDKRYTADILEVTPIDFWFSVPAVWAESAIDATRSAAEAAGFGSRDDDNLLIITEPEAAAIAVLSTAVERNPELIKVGQNILICDLGGGTLDFQVLTVTKLTPQLQTEETIPGQGGKAGSTFVDCNFHAWMQTTFGDAFKELPKMKTGAGSKFFNDWEIVKKSFTGKDLKKRYQVPFPALGTALRDRNQRSSSYDFEDHSVLVTGIQIADMFEPVIEKALSLVDKLSDTLKKKKLPRFKIMCLCGGLGSSEYVWLKFREYVRDQLDGRCQIFTDDRAWSAVVRGAAIRGLSGSLVLSKKAKRTYDIGVHQAFRPGIDHERDAFICPIKGKRAMGYVHWVIRIGQPFTENMRVKTNVYATTPDHADDEDLVCKWKLFSCALEGAPDREEHANVKEEGGIVLYFSGTHKRAKNDDGSYADHQAVQAAVVFKKGNERGTLMVEGLHGRKVVGTAKIDYSKTHVRQVISSSAALLDEL